MNRLITLLAVLISALNLSAANEPVKVVVANDSDINRKDEIVEISYSKVMKKMSADQWQAIIVQDAEGRNVPYQIVDDGNVLIFPVTVAADSETVYLIDKGIPEKFEAKTTGRFVPERKDDFSWENDRIAFRIYGPAIENSKELISNGIDLWLKRTSALVSKKWYDDELAKRKSYHTDGGEGLDSYDVGRTLGAGAMAPYVNDTLWFSNNFTSYEIIENGPLRMTARFTYAPFDVAGEQVSEVRTIRLDAGSQLNRITVKYDNKRPMMAAAGIVLRASDNVTLNPAEGYAAYSLPAKPGAGLAHVAVVMGCRAPETKIACGHIISAVDAQPSAEITYYSGGGWTEWGFPTAESWAAYVDNFSRRLAQPLSVKIK